MIQIDAVVDAYQKIKYQPTFYLFLHPEFKTCCPLSALFLSSQPKKKHALLLKRIKKSPIYCEDIFSHSFKIPLDYIKGFISGYDQNEVHYEDITDYMNYESGFINGQRIRHAIIAHFFERSQH